MTKWLMPCFQEKASKLQVTRNRTPNRHRWSGREYQALERTRVKELGKWHRNFGEGAPARVKDLLRKLWLVEDTRPLRLFIKTQHSANTKVTYRV